MNQEEQGKKMQQIIAKCWADEGFKQKLLADPAAMLAAEGAAIPTGLTVKAVENTDTLFHLVIPARPGDLSDEDLDKASGGLDIVWGDPSFDLHPGPWDPVTGGYGGNSAKDFGWRKV